MSLLSIDIDYFKKYNDTYGHPKGDTALLEVAKVLKKNSSRASDYAFRMGGEEFSIIFSGISIEESYEYTKEIVKDVENLKIEHKSSKCSPYLTISAGLVVLSSNNLVDVTCLYKYSDDALYEAKSKGKNQAVLSSFSK